MYNQEYDEYIRSILGYPAQAEQLHFQNNTYQETYIENGRNEERKVLEESYPEIYQIIYPMVKKACDSNNINSSEEINRLTDEIYVALEGNNEINVNINLRNEVGKEGRAENIIKKTSKTESEKISNETRRSQSNNNLRDLIKILLIRELLRKPNLPPPMPPHGRPPMPLPMRPPIRPREFQSFYDIYEH